MHRGYVKLWRKIIESRVFQPEGLLKVWIWCLVRADHAGSWVSVKTGRGTTEVEIHPGQFIYGRESAAKQLKMKPSSIRNRMEKLKNMRNLDIQPDTHYSIITVLNWDTYQPEKQKEDSEEDNQRTTKGQPKDTLKNSKNSKNIKKRKEYSMEFEQFWKAYPGNRKIGKGKAWDAWESRNGDRPPLETILSKLEEWRAAADHAQRSGGFFPEFCNPAVWLNQGRWDDEFAPPPRSGPQKVF